MSKVKEFKVEKKTRVRKYTNTIKEILLREYRESIGLTQFELGQLVGVNSRSISSYELGVRKPSTKVAVKLAKVFNVRIEEIFPSFE